MGNIINTNKEELCGKKKIIITIGCNPLETDNYIIDNKNFELRVLCLLKSKHIPSHSSKFDTIRYMRHGNRDFAW